MVDNAPFTSMDTDFGGAFRTGIDSAVNSVLSAVSGPLMATVTLWIIVQGILVMRGDTDIRTGITRIIKVALVVGILTSSGWFGQYVQKAFLTTIPNWAAQATNSTVQPVLSTPATFDTMWRLTANHVHAILIQLSAVDYFDAVSLCLIELAIMVILVVTFATYEFSVIVTGILVAAGPVLIIFYLFEATKGFTERWIGSLVTYSLLILLLNITLNIVLAGEKTYFRTFVEQPDDVSQIPLQIKTMLEVAMFLGMGDPVATGDRLVDRRRPCRRHRRDGDEPDQREYGPYRPAVEQHQTRPQEEVAKEAIHVEARPVAHSPSAPSSCSTGEPLAACKGPLFRLNADHWQPAPGELGAFEVTR